MSLVSSAIHNDRDVTRDCDICGHTVRCECYPRTGENQHIARRVTAEGLEQHLETHSLKEVLAYLKRIHQV